MSVKQIEDAVHHLPFKKREKLIDKLLRQLEEDAEDIAATERAIKEGGAVPYREFRKKFFKD